MTKKQNIHISENARKWGWLENGVQQGSSQVILLKQYLYQWCEVSSAYMKTRLLIKLNPSFTLKTLTGAAPRDGREQSHWQEVFRRIDTIYHTSNIALSSIIMSNIRFENFCSSCRTCPLNFRPVDPQNKSDLCCENRKNSTCFLSSF